MNYLTKNTREHGVLNVIKFPSLIEEHALSKAMHIAEEIYSLINFKRPR